MKSNKTVGIAFALVFASFVLSTISSLVSLHVVMRDNVRTMNKVIAMRIYDNISYELSEPISVAKTMSCDIGLKEMLQNESEETTESSSPSWDRAPSASAREGPLRRLGVRFCARGYASRVCSDTVTATPLSSCPFLRAASVARAFPDAGRSNQALECPLLYAGLPCARAGAGRAARPGSRTALDEGPGAPAPGARWLWPDGPARCLRRRPGSGSTPREVLVMPSYF